MKKFIAIIAALVVSVSAFAQNYQNALGLKLGYDVAVTYKTHVSSANALELGANLSGLFNKNGLGILVSGFYTWENQLVDGLWTYSVEAIWYGLQDCYADLRKNVNELYDTEIETLAAIGFSAMMHGYMVFDKDGNQLAPFRMRRWKLTE